MCFEINEKSREKLVKKMQKNGGIINCWKVLTKEDNESIYFYQIYKPGWNVPENDNATHKIDGSGTKVAHNGIYVYLTKAAAIYDHDPGEEKIVRVRCHLSHLLFVGHNKPSNKNIDLGDNYSTQVATFKKIFIYKEDLK